MVLIELPLIAAASNSDSMLLAVPGSPTSNNPRFPASVIIARSTSVSSPKNFRAIAGFVDPQINARTALGESFHPAGRAPLSSSPSAANSAAYSTSAGARRTDCVLALAIACEKKPPGLNGDDDTAVERLST